MIALKLTVMCTRFKDYVLYNISVHYSHVIMLLINDYVCSECIFYSIYILIYCIPRVAALVQRGDFLTTQSWSLRVRDHSRLLVQ